MCFFGVFRCFKKEKTLFGFPETGLLEAPNSSKVSFLAFPGAEKCLFFSLFLTLLLRKALGQAPHSAFGKDGKSMEKRVLAVFKL